MRSYWKTKLWAKFVNHFDVFDNLWSRKTQCDRSICLRSFATSGSNIKNQLLDLKTLPIFSPLKIRIRIGFLRLL